MLKRNGLFGFAFAALALFAVMAFGTVGPASATERHANGYELLTQSPASLDLTALISASDFDRAAVSAEGWGGVLPAHRVEIVRVGPSLKAQPTSYPTPGVVALRRGFARNV